MGRMGDPIPSCCSTNSEEVITMITTGIDVGAKNVKVLIQEDGKILGKGSVLAGLDTGAAISEAFDAALKDAGLTRDKIEKIYATGAGRNEVKDADDSYTEVGADAAGAAHVFPDARTVIDVGAEEGRAIRIDDRGKVVDFAINERCAAGAGAFTEAMARALEVPLEELGPLSLTSTKAVAMNAQCAVFGESEVVSLIHQKTEKQDIARAVHDAMATRITSMARRVGVEPPVALIGGVAYNPGFVDSLKRDLEVEVMVPDGPEFISALGAALLAAGTAK
jgi:predicted CoA-substrate-specific enzyme activase